MVSIKSTTKQRRVKKKKKKSRRIYRTSQSIRIINVLLESLLSESFPLLAVTMHLSSLGCPPTLCWSLDLLWGQVRVQSGPTPECSCLQGPRLSGPAHFLLWELSVAFYIFHRHQVCPLDLVDLICSLYSRLEGFGSSSSATLPLDFNSGFISTPAGGSPMGFAPESALGGLDWPCEGQGWRWCSCVGRRGSGSSRYSGGLAAGAAGDRVL